MNTLIGDPDLPEHLSVSCPTCRAPEGQHCTERPVYRTGGVIRLEGGHAARVVQARWENQGNPYRRRRNWGGN